MAVVNNIWMSSFIYVIVDICDIDAILIMYRYTLDKFVILLVEIFVQSSN